jgi:thiaminase/transcriptional activator TenA
MVMRPSQMLKNTCDEHWQSATQHLFCKELAEGKLPLEKMRVYLAQDYTFIDNFIRLAASAIHHAPSLSDRIPLAHFLGVIAGPENTYFQRSFEILDISLEQQTKPPLLEPTKKFQELMLRASQSGEYTNMIAVLCVAEWVYLSWAEPVAEYNSTLPFYFSEWIDLHTGTYFSSVVEHLRSQLDSNYPLLSKEQQRTTNRYFQDAVLLEKQFFDACYQ